MERFRSKVAAAGVGAVLSALLWRATAGNTFTPAAALLWPASVIAWTFAVRDPDEPGSAAAPRPRAWALLALGAALAVGAWLRFSDLALFPPDMTSDHVEKLLDARAVANGARPVFLEGNGGREAMQFYLLAALHRTGVPLGFDLLKALGGVEGLLGVVAIFALTRELAVALRGEPFASAAAALAAALAALGWWPVLLARLGLRIVLAPLFVGLAALLTVRALRSGLRRDFVRAGLATGAGLYAYQNVRMLPVLIAAGAATAIVRARGEARRRFLAGFGALVVVALAVFVPLARFAYDRPGVFWERSAGRLLGPDGRFDTGAAARVFGGNLARSFGMFHVAGDGAWITGAASGEPELDRVTGALLLAGLVAFAAASLRARDAAGGFLLLAIPVMLLPTALAVAMPQEVPSATRASGALPFVFALAGYGGAALGALALRALRRAGPPLVAGAGAAALVAVFLANQRAYFDRAMASYRDSSKPHRQLGALLAAFANGRGAFGNAFMVGFPYSWDHRAIALEAGDVEWPNGLTEPLIPKLEAAARRNAGTRFALDPARPLLFFLDGRDDAHTAELVARFPAARVRRVRSFKSDADFRVLVAPPGAPVLQ